MFHLSVQAADWLVEQHFDFSSALLGCSLMSVYMRDHDPVWSGNRSTMWDYYSYYNTKQESTLKQMLEPFVESLARSPTLPTFTAIYMAIQLLSLFLPLSLLLPSLASALSLCLCQYIFSISLLFSSRCLKSNTCLHINFDQSNVLICLAGETVTYQCRLSYSEMKKARRPASQNISGVTQTFTPCFIFSRLLLNKKKATFIENLLPVTLNYCPFKSKQMWDRKIWNDNCSWNMSLCLLSHYSCEVI